MSLNKPLEQVRAEEAKRLNQYKNTFKKGPGKAVLQDLQERYLLHGLNSETLAANNNPLGLAYVAGQRELILRLQAWVETPTNDLLEARFGKQEEDPHGGQSTIRSSRANIISVGDPLSYTGTIERGDT